MFSCAANDGYQSVKCLENSANREKRGECVSMLYVAHLQTCRRHVFLTGTLTMNLVKYCTLSAPPRNRIC